MHFKSILSVFSLIGIACLSLSNINGVPQAVTGAPGESGFSCNACHSGGNYNPEISIQLIKDNESVSTYIPSAIYTLRVVVSGQNLPKAYGFELVSLKASDNSDMGNWITLGDRVRTRNLLNRVYLQQSNAKTDGIFTATWKAPSTNVGDINFYFSGLAVNLNGSTTGDSHAMGQFTLTSETTSSDNNDYNASIGFKLYPNPASEFFKIEGSESEMYYIYNSSGENIKIIPNSEIKIDIGNWMPGLYFIQGRNAKNRITGTAKLVKL